MKTITTGDVMKTALRLPRSLHEQICQEAEANGRSMNTEMVTRLQESFEPRQDSNRFQRAFELPEELQALIETMVDNIIARAKGEPRRDYGRTPNPPR